MAKIIVKKPKFLPFDHTSGLEMFEPDFTCEDAYAGKTGLEDLEYSELEVLKETLQDDIADYDTIIDIQLEEGKRCVALGKAFDNETLANDRRRRQQLVVELRQVKKQMKMMRNNEKELIAS